MAIPAGPTGTLRTAAPLRPIVIAMKIAIFIHISGPGGAIVILAAAGIQSPFYL